MTLHMDHNTAACDLVCDSITGRTFSLL